MSADIGVTQEYLQDLYTQHGRLVADPGLRAILEKMAYWEAPWDIRQSLSDAEPPGGSKLRFRDTNLSVWFLLLPRAYLLADHSRTCQTTFIIVRTCWTVPIVVIQAVLIWAGCEFLLATTAGLILRVVSGTTRYRRPGYASPSLFRGFCVRYTLCGSLTFCIRHRQVLSGERRPPAASNPPRRIPTFGSPHQGHDQWERPVSKI